MSDRIRLAFETVTKRFDHPRNGGLIVAIQGVDIRIADGERVALIGPSGCGKSTLLNLASGLDFPSEGRVRVDGVEVSGPNRQVAFMLQKDLLLPWRSILENVCFGQEIRGMSRAERRDKALAQLNRFRIADFAEAYPHQLSGGMRQRAALARTMMMDPDVLLLDEPFSALDAQTKLVLQADLARTLTESRKTSFLITHDLDEAVTLSDRVLVMSKRPGRIVREIIVDLPHRDEPLQRRRLPETARYTGELMNLLDIGHAELV